MSTDVLGEVVEKVAGCPLDVFSNSRIFEPLQMRETLSGVPDDKLARLVSDYVRENGAFKELPRPKKVPPGISGGGGLFSTAEDYVKFLQCVLNGGVSSTGRLVSEASIDAMTQNQIGELFVEQQPAVHPELASAFPLGAGRDKFGFGFQIQATGEEPNLRSPGSLSWVES